MNFKKALYIQLYLLFFGIIFIVSKNIQTQNYQAWIIEFSIIVVVCLCTQLFFLVNLFNIPNLSFSIIFIVLSYLFHFGQTILKGLVPKYIFKGFDFIEFVNPSVFKESSTFSLTVLMLLVLGIMICSGSSSNTKKGEFIQNSMKNKKELQFYCELGYLLIILFFPIQMYKDMNNIIRSFAYGYSGSFGATMGSGEGIISIIGYVGYLGFALLIMSYSVINKKKAFSIYLLINIYLVLTMVSGGRGHQVTLILLFLYLEHRCIYKIRFKHIIIVTILGYIFIAILNGLAYLRIDGIQSFNQVLEVLKTSMKNSPVLKLIEEMGGSSYTPYLVFNQDCPPTYGITYLKGLITAIPNFNGWFTNTIRDANFAKLLNEKAIGGSFIGELYFNFNYFGTIIAIFIGYMLQKISIKLDRYLIKKEFLKFTYFIPFFTYSLWWTRDTFYSIIRPFLWISIIVWIASRLIIKLRKYDFSD